MGENKEKKISKKYIIIAIVIALLGAVIGIVVYDVIYCNIENKNNFNEFIDGYNELFKEDFNDDMNIYTMNGDWDKKELKITIKKKSIDYEKDCEEGSIDTLLENVGTQYCYNLMKPVIDSFNEHGYKSDNISYSVTILDKNDKEVLTHNY